jgi:hypothetical protein
LGKRICFQDARFCRRRSIDRVGFTSDADQVIHSGSFFPRAAIRISGRMAGPDRTTRMIGE